MRDPNRITPALAQLEKVWRAHPDWRLGQVIANAVREETHAVNCDPFYLEDNRMVDGLKKLEVMYGSTG